MSLGTIEDATVASEAGIRARRGARHWRRRVWRGFLWGNKVSHRWLGLVLGLLLVLETTTGAVLLYETQIDHWTNHGVYSATPSKHPISLARAAAIVERAHPKFDPDYVTLDTSGHAYGVYEVYGKPDDPLMVDPGTGRILGSNKENAVVRLFENVHECGLSCKGDPGYIGALNDHMPGLGLPGLHKVTVGDFVLGVLGLLLVYFGITGLVLWWPGVRRLLAGFTMRLGQGRYRRDRDLHRVIGFAVVPFLLMWGLTGANFELPFVGNAAYGLQGQHAPKPPTLTSRPAEGPDITFEQAERAALKVTGGGHVTAYSLPGTSAKGVFQIDVVKGVNPWNYDEGGQWNLGVAVDRHDAERTLLVYTTPAGTPADVLFQGWGDTLHFGSVVNPWLRIIWFLAGMSPLLLAVTGISTWLFRRKRRKAARTTSEEVRNLGDADLSVTVPA